MIDCLSLHEWMSLHELFTLLLPDLFESLSKSIIRELHIRPLLNLIFDLRIHLFDFVLKMISLRAFLLKLKFKFSDLLLQRILLLHEWCYINLMTALQFNIQLNALHQLVLEHHQLFSVLLLNKLEHFLFGYQQLHLLLVLMSLIWESTLKLTAYLLQVLYLLFSLL